VSDFDYGPIQTYEITWKSGHIETIQAHQVAWPFGDSGFFIGAALGVATKDEPRIRFHGEFDGHWRLVLDAPVDEIHTIRLLPQVVESIPTDKTEVVS